jgi:hypothetical protein
MNQLLDPNRFELSVGAAPDGDLIFTSTDARGTPGALNQYVTQTLGYPKSLMPDEKDLGRGFAVWESGKKTLAFVVTVGHGESAHALEVNLDAALSAALTTNIQSIWIPLMGTGAGGLSHLESLRVTATVLHRHLSSVSRQVKVRISLPQNLSEAEYTALYAAAYGPEYQRQSILNSLSGQVKDLLELCTHLHNLRKEDVPELSTTLFFLALAVADKSGLKRSEPLPASVVRFAQFVREHSGRKFSNLWSEYLRISVDDVATLRPRSLPERPDLSRNMMQWTRLALEYASARSRSVVVIEDFIRAMPSLEHGNVRHAIARLGIRVEEFDKEEFGSSGYTAENRSPVARRMLNDQATLDDKLGFKRYVDAMGDFILSDQTRGPLSISIEAPWGYGKSSLMAQLREHLDPARNRANKGDDAPATLRRAWNVLFGKRSFSDRESSANRNDEALKADTWTVWFNAWKYESSEQVWSGLMDALIKEIGARLPRSERELFLFRLNLSRTDGDLVRTRMHERLAQIGWGVVRWGLAGLATATLALKAWGYGIAHLSALGALWIPAAASIYFLRREKMLDEPAKFTLPEFLRIPDYVKGSGVLHQIQSDLDNVLKLATQLNRSAGGRLFRIAIFVDDLDRCAPNKIASVVEGISSFLASDRSEFFFVIGMDPQIVASALDNAHKELRTQLPQLFRETPLGWRFMDKFIQLPFTIPARHHEFAEDYLASICTMETGRALSAAPAPEQDGLVPLPADRMQTQRPVENREAGIAPAQEKRVVEDRGLQSQMKAAAVAENGDVRTVMNDVIARSHCSPREIRRILNLVRFILHLRVARIISEKKVPPLAAYASWIVLGLKWPELIRWLEWGFGELHSSPNPELKNRLARRLYLFEQLASNNTFEQWGAEVRTQINKADEVLWTQDRALYSFFQQEGHRNSDVRLSTAAEIGLF